MSNHPTLNRKALLRNPRYRDELFRQGQDVQEVISREIMAATEQLAKRIPFEAAYRLACQTADETGAEPRNHRELAQAIFAQCDMVTIGRELLESGNEKGASVRAGVFKTVVDWRYGKTDGDSQAGRTTVQIIWDLPGPARESADAE